MTSNKMIKFSETTRPKPGRRILTPPPLMIETIVRPTIKIVSSAAVIVKKINTKRIFILNGKSKLISNAA